MNTESRTFFAITAVAIASMGFHATGYAQQQEEEVDVEVDDNDEVQVEVDNDDVEVEVDAADDGYADLGLILGYQIDTDDHGIDAFRAGLDGRFGAAIDDDFNLVINPVVQITPSQITDEFILDTALNLLAEPVINDVTFYAGPGLALLLNFEDDPDTVTIGFNAIAGVGFDLDAAVEPFVQGRFHRIDISDGPNTWIGEVGVHF